MSEKRNVWSDLISEFSKSLSNPDVCRVDNTFKNIKCDGDVKLHTLFFLPVSMCATHRVVHDMAARLGLAGYDEDEIMSMTIQEMESLCAKLDIE
jgi:hypothetical protein